MNAEPSGEKMRGPGTSKSRICQYLLALAAIILISVPAILLSNSNANAFIGKIKIFGTRLPCAVICGKGRGIINTRFLGDALNTFVTGPSIDSFEAATNRSVDRGLAKFEEILARRQDSLLDKLTAFAEAQRDLLVRGLHDTSQEAVASLDEVLSARLKEGDSILETRLGNLEIVLNSSVQNLSSALKTTMLFATMLSCLGYVIYTIYNTQYIKKQPVKPLIPRLTAIAAVTFSAVIGIYILVMANDYWVRTEAVDKFVANYDKSLEDIDFNLAVYYATQLQFADRNSLMSQFRSEKARIIRDVFSRPALYTTNNGGRELISRIGYAQKNAIKATGTYDYDLSILYAFAIWQQGNDRLSEYISANIMAVHIASHRSDRLNTRSILLPIAQLYLNTYLANPIPDSIITATYAANSDISAEQVFTPISPPLENAGIQTRLKIAQLREIANNNRITYDNLAIRNPLFAHVRVAEEAVSVYKQVVSHYGELVRLNAELTNGSPEAKTTIRPEIRKVGSAIVRIWDRYLDFLSETDLPDQRAKLNNFRGLWPIYARAQAAVKIGDSDTSIGLSSAEGGIHQRWLTEIVQPNVRDSAFRLMTLTTNIDFKTNDAELMKVEKLASDFLKAVSDLKTAKANSAVSAPATAQLITTGEALAKATPTLGLMGCLAASTKRVLCDNNMTNSPVPLGTLLFKIYAYLDTAIVEKDPIRSSLFEHRTLPAF